MRRGDGCVGRRRRVYSLVAAQAPRLLVDGRAGASRGVVEDGLWIFHAIRVRREVEDERHLAAGRRGTGWVGEVRRWRRLCGIKFRVPHAIDAINLTHWLISTQGGASSSTLDLRKRPPR